MAYEKEIKELTDKVTRLVASRFMGDWDRAFQHFSSLSGTPGVLERSELMLLLEEAGIGSWLSRGEWADAIIHRMDTSRDRSISYDEFRAMLGQ